LGNWGNWEIGKLGILYSLLPTPYSPNKIYWPIAGLNG